MAALSFGIIYMTLNYGYSLSVMLEKSSANCSFTSQMLMNIWIPCKTDTCPTNYYTSPVVDSDQVSKQITSQLNFTPIVECQQHTINSTSIKPGIYLHWNSWQQYF
jgi:hypothetical protein